MKHPWLLWLAPALCGAVLPCGAAPRSDALTDDWQALRNLAPGLSVSISAMNHRRTPECEVLIVTDSKLTCGLERGAFATERTFLRNDIVEIRVEFPDHDHMILGGMIGGAVGGAIGGWIASHSRDPEALRADAGLGTLFGTSLGAAFGRHAHQHGQVLYKRK